MFQVLYFSLSRYSIWSFAATARTRTTESSLLTARWGQVNCSTRITLIALRDYFVYSHQSPGEPSHGLLLEAEAEEGTSCLLSRQWRGWSPLRRHWWLIKSWTRADGLEWATSKRRGREIVWDGDQETDPWINREVIRDEYCPAKSEGHQRKRDYGTLTWWPRVQSAEWLGRCARRGGNRISSIPHQGGSWKLPVRSTCHTNASVNILGMCIVFVLHALKMPYWRTA